MRIANSTTNHVDHVRINISKGLAHNQINSNKDIQFYKLEKGDEI